MDDDGEYWVSKELADAIDGDRTQVRRYLKTIADGDKIDGDTLLWLRIAATAMSRSLLNRDR